MITSMLHSLWFDDYIIVFPKETQLNRGKMNGIVCYYKGLVPITKEQYEHYIKLKAFL
jgi:hypothetical protein